MDEFYFEHIVSRVDERMALIWKWIFIIFTGAIVLFGVLNASSIIFLAGAAIGAVGYFLVIPRLYLEFEYLYLDKELSVDKIFNKESRKKCGNYELINMEIMAPLGSDELKAYESKNSTNIDYSGNSEDAKRYVIYLTKDQKLIRLVIEPDEAILKAIKSQFPRQVHL